MDNLDEAFLSALEALDRVRRMRAAFPEHATQLDAMAVDVGRELAETKARLAERDERVRVAAEEATREPSP